VIGWWVTRRFGNSCTDVHILDWPHTSKTISSRCHSIDSTNADQAAPEGTKTSSQKCAGREVRGIGGTRRESSKSARLSKNTRRRDSHCTSSLSRGAGAGRGTLWLAIKTPRALSMDTRWRGEKTDPIIPPFYGKRCTPRSPNAKFLSASEAGVLAVRGDRLKRPASAGRRLAPSRHQRQHAV